MRYCIRAFQDRDASALRTMFFTTVRKVNSQDYSESQINAWAPEQYDEQAWLEKIRSINPFIATHEDQPVGYADIQNDGYIDHFFCHWKHQGQGVGKALMHRLIHEAQEKGINRLYSQVSITAKPFFEHVGFDVIKEQRVSTGGEILTNYLMEKLL